jgi:dTDP-4-amino-4,6-dideoxygalactose transaminase
MRGGVPFVDFSLMHNELLEPMVELFRTAVQQGSFIGGPNVELFESDFAAFCQVSYALGVASGTDALRFALLGAGVEQADMVLTVPHTFIATAEAITQCGAIVEFVDIDPHTYTMDPLALEQWLVESCTVDDAGYTRHKASGRVVRAIVPVHLYGLPADIEPLLLLCHRYNLKLIEDACQAHGARYFFHRQQQWKRAGSLGDGAAFSFYPGKNLGAFGEAGAVTTNDTTIAHTVSRLRDHGQSKKYVHELIGYNGRLDAIQAAILTLKLKSLELWNSQRREAAHYYTQNLADIPELICPLEPSWGESVYHLYVVRLRQRDTIQQQMHQSGIATGLHYPIPLHLQQAYRFLDKGAGSYPVSEAVAREGLSLPIFAGITREQQDLVIEALKHSIRANKPLPAELTGEQV